MADISPSVRGSIPTRIGYMQQSSPIQSIRNMVETKNLKGLEAALKRERRRQEYLHSLLFKACHEDPVCWIDRKSGGRCRQNRSGKASPSA